MAWRANWGKRMESKSRQQELYALVEAMNTALDEQRWRRLPALHQQLMREFRVYEAAEASADELQATKATLHAAFAALIERRTQRADSLQTCMDNHQKHQEGVLAYSMITTISEQA